MKRRDIEVSGTFDIETEDWDTFVCGGIHFAEGVTKVWDWHHEDDMIDCLLASEGSFWAHNLGGFDGKWLIDHLIKREIYADLVVAGGRPIIIKVGKVKFYDSFALVKISLEDFSKASHVKKAPTGLRCTCGNFCGGYCAIKRNMDARARKRLLEYLETDCRALFESLQRLREFAAMHDIDLGATVGSSAWRNMARLLELPAADMSLSEHMFCRDAYFGGRVQLFCPSTEPGMPSSLRGYQFDVNSMYPSRLAYSPVPCGEYNRVHSSRDASRAFNASRPGIYRAHVKVPDMHFPPLPYRERMRVSYPTGRFEGVWALPELEHAESVGVSIEGIDDAMVWERERVIFHDWIDKMYRLRTTCEGGKKGPFGTWIKYMLNAPTGKMGSKPCKERVEICVEQERTCDGSCDPNATGICDGSCGAHTPLDEGGNIVTSLKYQLDACAHIEWASYLTSYARVEWHTQAMHAGERSVVYGDTDSIFCERKLTRNIAKSESDLGKWALECEYKNFAGLAPKVYSYEVAGDLYVKAKGVSLSRIRQPDYGESDIETQCERDCKAIMALESEWDRIDTGKTVGSTGPAGFKSSIRKTGRAFSKAFKGRTVSRGYGDRFLEAGERFTRPPTIEESKAR